MFKVGGSVRRQARHLLRSYARYRPPELDRRFGSLDVLVGRANQDLFACSDLTRFEHKAFSQNGEDGVLIEIFNRIGVTNRFFVEFGIQDGSEGNCIVFADVFGWSGVFIEADDDDFTRLTAKYDGFPVRTVQDLVTADRVDDIFTRAEVPADPDLVSIDIDGNDIYVWDALNGFRPRVVVIEYNSGISGRGPLAQPHDPTRSWDGTGAFGSTLTALDVVAARKGYRLAHTDLTGTNAFYVAEEIWPLLGVARVPRRNQNFGLTGITQAAAEPPGGWEQIGS